MTVPVLIVTRRKECVQQTQDMVAGQVGQDGALAVSHVEGGSGRGQDLVLLLRREVGLSHVVCVRERGRKRRHVTTTSAQYGVSGLHGHNARLLVGREKEQEPGLVMDLPLDSPLKG